MRPRYRRRRESIETLRPGSRLQNNRPSIREPALPSINLLGTLPQHLRPGASGRSSRCRTSNPASSLLIRKKGTPTGWLRRNGRGRSVENAVPCFNQTVHRHEVDELPVFVRVRGKGLENLNVKAGMCEGRRACQHVGRRVDIKDRPNAFNRRKTGNYPGCLVSSVVLGFIVTELVSTWFYGFESERGQAI